MTQPDANAEALSRDRLIDKVIEILKDMTSDWDLDFGGAISPTTLLVSDLEFESIDVVQFVVQLEEVFQRKDLPFEKLLMIEGRYKDDLRVNEVANFLHEYL